MLLSAALVVAACSGSSSKATTPTSTVRSAGATAPRSAIRVGLAYDLGGLGDNGFNDGAATGLIRAEKQLGVAGKDVAPNPDGSNRQQLLQQLADVGFNPVFAVGPEYAPAVKAVAAARPGTRFAIVDDATVQLPNVTDLTFADEQGSFLVGAAAALKSTAGHVGFVGGVDSPAAHKFDAGFTAGATAVKPTIVIDRKYLSAAPDVSGLDDPAGGQQAAAAMYAGGDDIVYVAAGRSDRGVVAAAEAASTPAKKVFVIGSGADLFLQSDSQGQQVILTSMVEHIDVAVFDYIKGFQGGRPPNGQVILGLKDGAVSYATSSGLVGDIKAQLDVYQEQIASGDLVVPSS